MTITRPIVAAVMLATGATVSGLDGAALAAPASTHLYSCRSAHVGAYWYGGIESDACDGLLPDGRFGGEAVTGFDPTEQINHGSARVLSCTVQLNRVENGHAVPVPGADNTESGADPDYFDGSGFCDAVDAWRPAPGLYNVTVTYRTPDGVTVETVQGPVAYYPGS